jgi:hypothetical protein
MKKVYTYQGGLVLRAYSNLLKLCRAEGLRYWNVYPKVRGRGWWADGNATVKKIEVK